MIRRQFDLDGKQVLVTYDQTTDTMHVGTRDNDYDSWSTPLTLVSTDDDPVGRVGGPGSVRGASVEGGLLGRLVSLLREYDVEIADPGPVDQTATTVDPATAQQVAAVPNQTSRPAQDTTAMQEDPRRDRRGN